MCHKSVHKGPYQDSVIKVLKCSTTSLILKAECEVMLIGLAHHAVFLILKHNAYMYLTMTVIFLKEKSII